MTDRVLTAKWTGETFELPPVSRMKCREWFAPDQMITLEATQPRHLTMHRRFMAMVQNYFDNLPEWMADAPFGKSPDSLRYYALIKCGFCETITHVAKTTAEAERVADTFHRMPGFAIVHIEDKVVMRDTALSQAFSRMNQKQFRESSERVEAFLATLVGAKEDAA